MADRGTEEVQQAVRKKYAEISRSVVGKFRYLTGKAGAAALGYDLCCQTCQMTCSTPFAVSETR